ncbi:MAG: metal-dependent transcriptional regulator [Candidatus Omnitrophota bacterium]
MKKLSSNMEDYLEAIALLKREKGVARVNDIGRFLRVKNSSVSAALNTLSKKKHVVHERYGYVELTTEGQKLASGVQKRHDILLKFLCGILKIDPEVARVDACKMEHAISQETLDKLIKFSERAESCPGYRQRTKHNEEKKGKAKR